MSFKIDLRKDYSNIRKAIQNDNWIAFQTKYYAALGAFAFMSTLNDEQEDR